MKIMYQIEKAFTVATYTFRDLLRSKILWNAALIGLGLALVSFVAGEFTFGVPARVATDLGLAALSLSGYGLSFFAAISLIRQEEESRTIYLIISRPIRRSVFLIGKIAGVAAFLALNYLLILSFVLTALAIFGSTLGPIGWSAVALSFVELLLILVLLVLISLVANRALTIIAGLVILVGGHALGETRQLNFVKNYPWLDKTVAVLDVVFPSLHRLNLKDHVLYEVSVPGVTVVAALGYALCYGLAALCLAGYLIERKDFD